MMNDDLINDINFYLKSKSNVNKLDINDATTIVNKIADKYVVEREKLWWWESLSSEYRSIEYGDSDGLDIIRNLILPIEIITLVVTDDEHEPWPVFQGPVADILNILGELHFFEYILVGAEEKWCIFDTHHNNLILVGDLK